MEKKLGELETKIAVKFKDKNILKTALIHRSYLNEHPEETLPNNERLEFLGDSVLGMIVSAYLYEKYQTHSEGDLTNFRSAIVNAKMLAKVASDLKLGDYLFLSKGEEATGGRTRQFILANTFEALIGAIYLDQGFEQATKFVHRFLIPHLTEIIEKKLYKDFKSLLQEKAQDEMSITPTYKVLDEKGPDHAKIFTVGVFLSNRRLAEGVGTSKQEAEQQAARTALENWPKKE